MRHDYLLIYSRTSRNQIRKLHPELKSIIRARLKVLWANPLIGKKLIKELSVCWSLRANRYRIIYRIMDREIEIHYVGHRKDIYELFRDQIAGILSESGD